MLMPHTVGTDGAGAHGVPPGAMQTPAEASGRKRAGSQPVQAASMGTTHEPVQGNGTAPGTAAVPPTSRTTRKNLRAAAAPGDLRQAAVARNGTGSAEPGPSQQPRRMDSARNGKGSAELGGSQQPQRMDSARNGKGTAESGASQQPQRMDSRGGSREDAGAIGSQQESAGDKGEGTLLQPWSDHHGRLNEPFLRSLTQRAVSIVIRHPGEETTT